MALQTADLAVGALGNSVMSVLREQAWVLFSELRVIVHDLLPESYQKLDVWQVSGSLWSSMKFGCPHDQIRAMTSPQQCEDVIVVMAGGLAV